MAYSTAAHRKSTVPAATETLSAGATTGTRSCEISLFEHFAADWQQQKQKGVRVFSWHYFLSTTCWIYNVRSAASTASGGRRSSASRANAGGTGGSACVRAPRRPAVTAHSRPPRSAARCAPPGRPGRGHERLIARNPARRRCRRPAPRYRAAIPRTRVRTLYHGGDPFPGAGAGAIAASCSRVAGIRATSRTYPQCEPPRRPRQHDSQRHQQHGALVFIIRFHSAVSMRNDRRSPSRSRSTSNQPHAAAVSRLRKALHEGRNIGRRGGPRRG